MRHYSISKRFSCALLCLTLTIPTFALAGSEIRSMTGQLNLSAIVSGEPAFKPVTWHLKPKNKPNRDVTIDNRHAAVIDLEAGDYEVTAVLGEMVKIDKVTIKEGGKHQLVMKLK